MSEFAPTPELDEAHVARPGTAEDLDEILAIEHAAQPSPWSAAVFAREFELEYSRCWVVEPRQGGSMVGYLVFWIIHDEIHILNLAVDRSARRRGIARGLIADLLEQARAARMTLISLEVRASNEAAIALYRGFRFEKIADRPEYYADNREDAEVLALILDEQ